MKLLGFWVELKVMVVKLVGILFDGVCWVIVWIGWFFKCVWLVVLIVVVNIWCVVYYFMGGVVFYFWKVMWVLVEGVGFLMVFGLVSVFVCCVGYLWKWDFDVVVLIDVLVDEMEVGIFVCGFVYKGVVFVVVCWIIWLVCMVVRIVLGGVGGVIGGFVLMVFGLVLVWL